MKDSVPVRVLNNSYAITHAINSFSRSYHDGFFNCRSIGRQYLAEAVPADDLVAELATSVRRTLGEWGADKRKAPGLQPDGKFSNALRDPEVHTRLAALAAIPLPELGVFQKHRYLRGKPGEAATLASFDSNLLTLLRVLHDRFFIGNTNVTYPMKAMLLITGYMPALDSNVRRGLRRSGFSGMSMTQCLLPDNAGHLNGRKITRLPFLLGECWTTCAQQLQDGVAQSKFPNLWKEPGRVFDILLFMQADENNPILLTSDLGDKDWYELR